MEAAWNASPIATDSTDSRCSRSMASDWYGRRTATPRLRTRPTSLLGIGFPSSGLTDLHPRLGSPDRFGLVHPSARGFCILWSRGRTHDQVWLCPSFPGNDSSVLWLAS